MRRHALTITITPDAPDPLGEHPPGFDVDALCECGDGWAWCGNYSTARYAADQAGESWAAHVQRCTL